MKTQISLIDDDNCARALKPLTQEGRNEIKTFIVCTSLVGLLRWHLPKVGYVTLNLTVYEGEVVEGTITFDNNEAIMIECITSGLSEGCLAVMIKWGYLDIKFYTNIPLRTGADPALLAIIEAMKCQQRGGPRELEDVYVWLSSMPKLQ